MHIARSSATQSDATGTSLESAVSWIADLMTGSIAISLCVIAVAFLGFTMLTGRVPIRRGLFIALGAFILLAAPIIATGFAQIWQGQNAVSYAPEAIADSDLGPREDLPPSDYDPYAGASIRGD